MESPPEPPPTSSSASSSSREAVDEALAVEAEAVTAGELPPPPPGQPSFREYVAARLDAARDWADSRRTNLRFALQLSAAATLALALRRAGVWRSVRNSASAARELVGNNRKLRVQCAEVVAMPGTDSSTMGNRLVLRCQHVPLLRRGFFEQRPIVTGAPATTGAAAATTTTPGAAATSADFSRYGDELLDIELFGTRAANGEDADALADMLRRALVDASPRPLLTVCCVAHGTPPPVAAEAAGAASGGGASGSGGRTPLAAPPFPVQALVRAPTSDMRFHGFGNRGRGAPLLTPRTRAEDLLAHAAALGLPWTTRLRLRVLGVHLAAENFLPSWAPGARMRELNAGLVRSGFARVVHADDVVAAAPTAATKAVPVRTEHLTLSAVGEHAMEVLEAEEAEARTCDRGLWALQRRRRQQQQQQEQKGASARTGQLTRVGAVWRAPASAVRRVGGGVAAAFRRLRAALRLGGGGGGGGSGGGSGGGRGKAVGRATTSAKEDAAAGAAAEVGKDCGEERPRQLGRYDSALGANDRASGSGGGSSGDGRSTGTTNSTRTINSAGTSDFAGRAGRAGRAAGVLVRLGARAADVTATAAAAAAATGLRIRGSGAARSGREGSATTVQSMLASAGHRRSRQKRRSRDNSSAGAAGTDTANDHVDGNGASAEEGGTQGGVPPGTATTGQSMMSFIHTPTPHGSGGDGGGGGRRGHGRSTAPAPAAPATEQDTPAPGGESKDKKIRPPAESMMDLIRPNKRK